MRLEDFLAETQADVRAQLSEGASFPELIFAEIVMQHMADIGMTFEPVICHYQGKVGNANLKLTGYAVSDESDQLDLFVSLYEGVDVPTPIPDSETKTAVEQCLKFLALCAEGKLAGKLDPTHDVYSLALTIQGIYNSLEQIRVFVITDRIAKAKSFKSRDIGTRSVRLEVMDIERLFRHASEGKPRDELVADFTQLSGSPLPCVYVPGGVEGAGYALAAIPGEALRSLYEKFGARLLEANVRSFLSVKGTKGVNAGIQNTLRTEPERFMAFNNGIVLVVDEISIVKTPEGHPGLSALKGIQIVNGGQTTASIYFTKRKFPETDLSNVRVPAKIIVVKGGDVAKEEGLISDISRFANSQNAVRQSDLSANKPFHIDVERLSLSVYCPDGTGRWFYERAAGSYNTLLTREGTTPARMRTLKESLPLARRITKTELAQYLMAWNGAPEIVSLGAQKCFDRFMSTVGSGEDSLAEGQIGVAEYKNMVAKTILFRAARKLIRPMFQAFQANTTAYTVSLLSLKAGSDIDLDRIWQRQGISAELTQQIARWAREVNDELHRTAGGRMISEWAKKAECKDALMAASFTPLATDIPEVRASAPAG